MKEKLKALGERAIKARPQLKTEEATKHALIIPFLIELGYDVYNPTEVIPEYIADVPGVKNGEKVDYAIMQDGKAVILIECKHCEEELPKHSGQLFRYYSTLPGKKLAMLTNGFKYMLFSDLEATNKLDEKPFFEFDITNIKDSQIEEIKKLHKSALNMESILDSANELKYKKDFKAVIMEELTNPTKDFLAYLIKRVYEGRLTDTRLTFFEPIARQSIKQVIDEIFTDRLNSVLATNAKKAADEKAAKEAAEEAAAQPEDKIVTTQDELDCFAVIKAIGCEVVSAERIQYKDFVSHFNVNLDGKLNKTFCKIKLGERRKNITLIKADKTENTHDLPSPDNIYTHKNEVLECIKSFGG